MAAEAGTDTAFISWSVPDFSITQLEFTVQYGTEEDSLDETSDTVTSSDDTSDYSVRLSDLSLGTTYYFKVVTTFSDFTLESDVDDFTTEELGNTEHFSTLAIGKLLNVLYSSKWITRGFYCYTGWHSLVLRMGPTYRRQP